MFLAVPTDEVVPAVLDAVRASALEEVGDSGPLRAQFVVFLAQELILALRPLAVEEPGDKVVVVAVAALATRAPGHVASDDVPLLRAFLLDELAEPTVFLFCELSPGRRFLGPRFEGRNRPLLRVCRVWVRTGISSRIHLWCDDVVSFQKVATEECWDFENGATVAIMGDVHAGEWWKVIGLVWYRFVMEGLGDIWKWGAVEWR